VDARAGVTEQSRRHTCIAALLRIPHLVIAVNKMDLVNWSHERFVEIRREFEQFLPRLAERQPASLFEPAIVSDRSDGKIAHLDGLNLSRAWCWRSLTPLLPSAERAVAENAAEAHLAAALPHIAGDYMGEHWLASFALLALLT